MDKTGKWIDIRPVHRDFPAGVSHIILFDKVFCNRRYKQNYEDDRPYKGAAKNQEDTFQSSSCHLYFSNVFGSNSHEEELVSPALDLKWNVCLFDDWRKVLPHESMLLIRRHLVSVPNLDLYVVKQKVGLQQV